MKRYVPIKKSLVMAKNGKGAAIPLDIPLYDAIVEKFEVIEAMETSPKRSEGHKKIPQKKARVSKREAWHLFSEGLKEVGGDFPASIPKLKDSSRIAFK